MAQVQDIVVGNKTFTEVAKPSEIVQLLLNEDQLANLDSSGTTAGSSSRNNARRPSGQGNGLDTPLRDLWTDEGDEFFGQPQASGSGSIQELEDDGTPVPTTERRRGRGGGPGSRRGRKPGPKPGRRRANGVAEGDA